jgi:hypothetical protein
LLGPEPSEPPPDDPAILTYPTIARKGQPKEWALRRSGLDELNEVYGNALDVAKQCAKARLWCVNNPSRRKTAKGMPEFLRRWMETEVNRGRGRPQSRRGPPKPTPRDADSEFLERCRNLSGRFPEKTNEEIATIVEAELAAERKAREARKRPTGNVTKLADILNATSMPGAEVVSEMEVGT